MAALTHPSQRQPAPQALPCVDMGAELLAPSAWDDRLRAVCGAFHTRSAMPQLAGKVGVQSVLGVDIASINVSSASVVRGRADVRHDGAAYYFLIAQGGAHAHIQQHGQSVLLHCGDMVVVDSAQESHFICADEAPGAISRQVSVHLPRELLPAAFATRGAGQKIGADTPLAQCVWQQLLALRESAALLTDPRLDTAELRSLFLAAFAQLFNADKYQQRFVQIVLALLRQHCAGALAVDHFADLSFASRRTFFRIFQRRDLAFADLVRLVRLLRFLQLFQASQGGTARRSISSMAYAAGFTDISNFNHTFKACFGLTPGALLTERS
ncbi:MAG: helix-turn-helix domain-containing protein [Rhodoferax sp.]